MTTSTEPQAPVLSHLGPYGPCYVGSEVEEAEREHHRNLEASELRRAKGGDEIARRLKEAADRRERRLRPPPSLPVIGRAGRPVVQPNSAEWHAIERQYAQEVAEIRGETAYRRGKDEQYKQQHGHYPVPDASYSPPPAPAGSWAAYRDIQAFLLGPAPTAKTDAGSAGWLTPTTSDLVTKQAEAFGERMVSGFKSRPKTTGPRYKMLLGAPVSTKVLSASQGLVSAVVSVTGNVDRQKDVIHPGAFGPAVKVANAKGRLPTIVYGHQRDDIDQVLGSVRSWAELQPGDSRLPPELASKGYGGLQINAQFELDVDSGRKAFTLLRGGHLSEWSFAFDVGEFEYDSKGIRHLKTVEEIYEVSLVIIGANQDTWTGTAA